MISVQENTKNKELRTNPVTPDEANIENLQNIDGITFTNGNSNTVVHHRRHRNSRANFKNPPQPIFCIKCYQVFDNENSSESNQLLFINVLSWGRIANPVNPLEPVPLYGGMRVHPSSPLKDPTTMIYAVMASPDVLKQAGRKCADTPERMNLVDLMCEFVEAMNPGLRLSRHPEILKDRDLCGELKDVWNAVQQVRDKEKAGIQQLEGENIIVYTEFGPESAPTYSQSENTAPALPPTSTETEETEQAAPLSPTPINSLEIIQTSAVSGNVEPMKDEKDSKDNKETDKVEVAPKKAQDQVKTNNQKNKESPHHFFPKFRSSNNKDQNKEPKDSNTKNEDDESNKKPKKTLNFFRRHKTSQAAPQSPQKIIQEGVGKEKDENLILEQNGNKLKKLEDLEGEKNMVESAGVATVVAK